MTTSISGPLHADPDAALDLVLLDQRAPQPFTLLADALANLCALDGCVN